MSSQTLYRDREGQALLGFSDRDGACVAIRTSMDAICRMLAPLPRTLPKKSGQPWRRVLFITALGDILL